MEDWTAYCSGHCLLSGIKYSKTIHESSDFDELILTMRKNEEKEKRKSKDRTPN
jgi:hypothetical protein